MTNYICINGNKTELTEEQLKQLGIKIPNTNPFKRVERTTPFYFITAKGKAEYGVELNDYHCSELYKTANYCTDKSLMEQRALHETLNRLLWRYSMEHDGDKIDWNNASQKKYHIFVEMNDGRFHIDNSYTCCGVGRIYFAKESTARAAIEEIIKPFMAAHPDFKF